MTINNTKIILGLTFLIYLIFGTAFTLRSITYPMVSDDLHLIRNFSTEQIINSFHGNWEPDGFETPGLRPLTMIFNQVRYSLFGENVVLHHLLLTVLLTTYFVLFGWINHRFGIPWKYTLA